jgi:hypothetical protein
MEINDLSRFDTELKYKVVVDKTDDGNIRLCLIDSDDRKEGIVLCSTYTKLDRFNSDEITDEQFVNEVIKPHLCKLRCNVRMKFKNGEPVIYISDKRDAKKLSELK